MATSFFYCPHCGKVIVAPVSAKTDTICCGDVMKLLVPKATDELADKHVPVVTRKDKYTLKISIGEMPHPTSTEHYIEFIAIESAHGLQLRYLAPYQPAQIYVCDTQDPVIAIYAYCNKHGLWMTNQIPSATDSCKREKKGGCCTMLLILLGLFFPWTGCSSGTIIDNTPIPTLSLQRYLGRWYEIARYDHRFERDLMNCIAQYSMNDDGSIRVTNSGIVSGKRKESVGKAKTTGTPGLLRVSFFGPFYSDYRVLMLSEDYTYALVGSASDKYLWILSRTPVLPDATIQRILQEASRRGYDTTSLMWVDQTLSITDTEPDTPDGENNNL